MKGLSVFDWRNLSLPLACASAGTGWLLPALAGAENSAVYLAAALGGFGLAVGAWLAREGLAHPENSLTQRGILALVTTAAALGMINGAARLAMLVSVLAGLAWWDLADFTGRMAAYSQPAGNDQERLAAAHLGRLALVLGVGLIMGLAALGVRISLNLETAMLLGALAVLFIRIAISRSLG